MSKFARAALAVGAMIAWIAAAPRPIWADATPDYRTQSLWVLHLMEGGRYSEAADAVQTLLGSNLTGGPGYQLRGTLELYIGDFHRAAADFRSATEVAPTDASSQYGCAICEMASGDLGGAERSLDAARACPNITLGQTADLDTADAYLALLRGDAAGAVTICARPGAETDKTRLEVQAIAIDDRDPKQGSAALREMLQTPTGAPIVREDDGVRPMFAVPSDIIEPAIVQATLQQLYQVRLSMDIAEAQRGTGAAKTVFDTVILKADAIDMNDPPIVSFYVDNQFASMVNTAPFAFHWDTRQVSNGPHQVRIQTTDSSGAVTGSRTMLFDVANKDTAPNAGDHGGIDESDYAAIENRLWNLLRLHPSLDVAEFRLAEDLRGEGDRSGYQLHRAIAAAIDPDYRGGREYLRGLLRSVGESQNTKQSRDLWQGSIVGNRIALTFDDGPNPVKTPLLLDALDAAHVPATFFVVGSRAALCPDLLRRMARRGDDVENHSYTHPNLAQCTSETAELEIARTSVLIRAITGKFPLYLRPPGGNTGGMVEGLTRQFGMINAFWTVDVLPAEDLGSKDGLVKFVMERIHPGDIVLMHNGSDVTIAAIPDLVTAIEARGYKCVTLDAIGSAPPRKGGVAPHMHE